MRHPNSANSCRHPTPQRGSVVTSPPSQLLAPPLLMRSNSLPHTPSKREGSFTRRIIELKLSLSEEDAPSSSGRRSTDSEGGTMADDDNNATPQSVRRALKFRSGGSSSPTMRQQQSSTPFSQESCSSLDDQGIANELRAYSLSTKLGSRGSLESASAPLSGRDAPVDGHHANSIILLQQQQHPDDPRDIDAPTPVRTTPVRSFYATPQSAMLAASFARSAAKPRAHHDSSFLTNLRDGWAGNSGASVSESFVSSPRGAFGGLPEAEGSPRQQRDDASEKSSAPSRTPQSNIQSLAYSNEVDHDRRGRRVGSRSAWCGHRHYGSKEEAIGAKNDMPDAAKFKVYSSRWMMLLYLSLLNGLSDWTCYSIAPISILTSEALDVDTEILVTVFLASSVVGTFLEPAVLKWLGLRRSVLLGALLLLAANVVKSGTASTTATEGRFSFDEQTILYVGFSIAGLSQPLYQCTASILVNGWFPEWERGFASGVASNSKHLGIGCAFFFGTLLVETGEDVLPYFHLLSVISMALFVGMAMQFEDAPPTPPLETARVIRGTVERPLVPRHAYSDAAARGKSSKIGVLSPNGRRVRPSNKQQGHWQGGANNGASKAPLLPSPASFGSIENTPTEASSIAQQSFPAFEGPTELAMENIDTDEPMAEFDALGRSPSPIMPGPVVARGLLDSTPNTMQSYGSTDATSLVGIPKFAKTGPRIKSFASEQSDDLSALPSPFPNLKGTDKPTPARGGAKAGLEYYNFGPQFQPKDHLPATEDDGAEPILIQTPRHLDVDIRGDQIWQSLRACFARKGFSHCVFAFAASGIAMNTIATFMGYLVTLNGDEGKYNVGTIGGSFQLLIMFSSMVCGRWTDETRKSYFIIIALLAIGALALALCDANLDSDESLWLYLLMVAVFLGPLQRCSLSLGVEVAYPLSENTVIIILQLFSNLLSAACIPAFRVLRDISWMDMLGDISSIESAIEVLRKFSASMPDFTYSFYLLVLIYAMATLYFATFDIQHLRNEVEEREKKQRAQDPQPSSHEFGSIYLKPKPPIGTRKYPFLIPPS